MDNAVLKHKKGEDSYQDYPLSQMITTIGRSSSNDIVIKDTSISRLHIRVENRNGTFYVVDNNSSNGTFLNRRKVTESPLKDGDTIMAGRVQFYFACKETPSEVGQTQPLSIMGEGDASMDSTISLNRANATLPSNGLVPPPLPSPGPAPLPTDDIAGDIELEKNESEKPKVIMPDPTPMASEEEHEDKGGLFGKIKSIFKK